MQAQARFTAQHRSKLMHLPHQDKILVLIRPLQPSAALCSPALRWPVYGVWPSSVVAGVKVRILLVKMVWDKRIKDGQK